MIWKMTPTHQRAITKQIAVWILMKALDLRPTRIWIGPSKYGETIQLKPFNLNLGNPLENRYIRLVIALEFRGGSLKSQLLAKTPKIRDIVVSIGNEKKTMEFLLGSR